MYAITSLDSNSQVVRKFPDIRGDGMVEEETCAAADYFRCYDDGKVQQALTLDRNLRGRSRAEPRRSSEQAGTVCGATSVASGQLACEVQQGPPHQPLPTAMLSGAGGKFLNSVWYNATSILMGLICKKSGNQSLVFLVCTK